MNSAAALAITNEPKEDEIDTVVENAILKFLSGESDGADLLQALYGAPLDEPIPSSMLALVRGARARAVTPEEA